MRKWGFYWIRQNRYAEWEIAHYNDIYDYWYLPGKNIEYKSFYKIDEEIIIRNTEMSKSNPNDVPETIDGFHKFWTKREIDEANKAGTLW